MSTSMGLLLLLLLAAYPFGEAQQRERCRDHSGRQGTCVPLSNCPPLRDLFSQIKAGTAPSGSFSLIRRSVCLPIVTAVRLCCATTQPQTLRPTTPIFSNPQTPRPALTPRPSQVPQPPSGSGSPGLPSRCGTSGLTNFIIDGEDAPLLAWPWMVILRGTDGRGRGTWFCGGVLISDRYVLSAAHCFKRQNNIRLEFARIGEHTLSNNPDCMAGLCSPPPQDIRIERVISHPQYGSPCTECNDIAMLKLSQPAILDTRFVVPVCLPVNPPVDMGYSVREFDGKFAWAAGWGSTSRDPAISVTPQTLQQVQLPIQSLRYCEQLKRNYPNGDMVLCAGGEGRDTCRGDSGGPLLLSNVGGTRRYVVGITSLGPTVCGTRDTQGLYTNVHHYVPWILGVLRS